MVVRYIIPGKKVNKTCNIVVYGKHSLTQID